MNKGTKVQIFLPKVPNPQGGIYLTEEQDPGTRQMLFNALHGQTAQVVSEELTSMPNAPAVFSVRLLSGPWKNKNYLALLDWMTTLQVPCVCPMQKLLAQGCQDPMHI